MAKVLVIDDEEIIRERLKRLLDHRGIRKVCTGDFSSNKSSKDLEDGFYEP